MFAGPRRPPVNRWPRRLQDHAPSDWIPRLQGPAIAGPAHTYLRGHPPGNWQSTSQRVGSGPPRKPARSLHRWAVCIARIVHRVVHQAGLGDAHGEPGSMDLYSMVQILNRNDDPCDSGQSRIEVIRLALELIDWIYPNPDTMGRVGMNVAAAGAGHRRQNIPRPIRRPRLSPHRRAWPGRARNHSVSCPCRYACQRGGIWWNERVKADTEGAASGKFLSLLHRKTNDLRVGAGIGIFMTPRRSARSSRSLKKRRVGFPRQ